MLARNRGGTVVIIAALALSSRAADARRCHDNTSLIWGSCYTSNSDCHISSGSCMCCSGLGGCDFAQHNECYTCPSGYACNHTSMLCVSTDAGMMITKIESLQAVWDAGPSGVGMKELFTAGNGSCVNCHSLGADANR